MAGNAQMTPVMVSSVCGRLFGCHGADSFQSYEHHISLRLAADRANQTLPL